jgi:hypothetical protein
MFFFMGFLFMLKFLYFQIYGANFFVSITYAYLRVITSNYA